MTRKTFFAALLLVVASGSVPAQEETYDEAYLELVRSDIKAEKVGIVTEVMQLTEQQGQVFWPIYREYEHELSKLGDQRIALIKEYVDSFYKMTEDRAKDLVDRSFKLDGQRSKLVQKYYRKLSREMDAVTAARFVQVEGQMMALVDLQVALQLPLMEKAAEVIEAE